MSSVATAVAASDSTVVPDPEVTRPSKEVEARRQLYVGRRLSAFRRAGETSKDPEQTDSFLASTTTEQKAFNRPASAVASFTPLQEWDGYITAVKSDALLARLTDVTNAGEPDAEDVEIPFAELNNSTIERAKVGSLFRWSIGYQRTFSGEKTRVSRIVLRQLPLWGDESLRSAEKEAEELINSINWKQAA